MSAGCLLCYAVDDHEAAPIRRLFTPDELRTEILLESETFAVILDIAPVSPGHMLLVTQGHCSSFGALNRAALQQAEGILPVLSRALYRAYSRSVVIFEHGAADAAHRGGGCIDHAHLHIVPSDVQLSSSFQGTPASALEALEELARFDSQEYLYVKDGDGAKVFAVRELVSQHTRRLMVRAHGQDIPWNWREHLAPDRIDATRARLRETLRVLVPILLEEVQHASLSTRWSSPYGGP